MTVEATTGTHGAAEVDAVKEQQRAAWAAGDYAATARHIWEVGARLVDRLEIASPERVLDVACGSGNAAIRAAQAGGRVTGLDLTPELLEAARRVAAEAGVEVEWRQGDAEELPFDAGSFDVVTSTFGCMFAPRHAVAAREIDRVLRPGGRIGICSWTPEGAIGDFFATLGAHLPAPPPSAEPPLSWGSEPHVRELFAASDIELRFEREVVELRFPSVGDAVADYERNFGPIVKARELLEPQGRWPALHEDLVALWHRHNSATDGTVAYPAEYLVVTGVKPRRGATRRAFRAG